MDKESLKNQFKTWLYYKVSEFNDLGYTTIETEDLAHYFADYRWKKNLPKNLFEQIFQINQLNINEYFDFESEKLSDADYRRVDVRCENGQYIMEGQQLQKIFDSTNFNDMGSLRYLYKYIEKRN